MGANYVFACARVRSVEKNLLGKEKLGMMIEARTMEDALKILTDAQYGEEGEVYQADAYEKILQSETKKLYRFIKEIAPKEIAFGIFSYPFDYHNIKTLLKAEILEMDARSILMEGGTIEPAVMAVLIKERNTMALTEHMRKAVEEALDTHARTKDPQCIDLICDTACYKDVCEAAKKSGNSFVQSYVRLMIDTTNLKTFVRAKKMGQPFQFYKNVFIEGGDLPLKIFLSGYEESLYQFASRIEGNVLFAAASEGLLALKEQGSYTALERLCDNALIQFIKNAKYISFGIEPIVAYTAAKQAEIKCVRIVLAGKAANLAPQLIRERLRETYG